MTTTEYGWQGSPYPGLRSFRTEEADVFYGRKRETRELIQRLANPKNRMLAVIGPDGVGKSSLIQAGVLPQLYAGAFSNSERWIQLRIAPGEQEGNPFQVLAKKLTPLLQGYGSRYHFLPDLLKRQPEEWAQLNQPLFADSPPGTEILLVIDPLEDLFTLVAPELQDAFIQLLLTASQAPRQRILLGLQENYLDNCQRWPGFAELLEQNSYRLEMPGFGALFESISSPANRAQLEFEEKLALRILQESGNEPDILTKLIFTLDQLYRQCGTNNYLTHAAYEEIHGVHGSINYCAEKALERLNDVDVNALEDIFRIFLQIDDQGRIIRPYVTRTQLQVNSSLTRLADVLIELGFVQQIQLSDQKATLLRLSHAAIVSCWNRLNEWVKLCSDDLALLNQLKKESVEWELRGRPSTMQWPYQKIVQARSMIARRQPSLNQRERDFILPENNRLIEQFKNLELNHQQRCEIGERLALIGDHRPGVGLNDDGLPDIVWCEVPAGIIMLEGDKGQFPVESCFISKYPLTWIQYRSFLEADDGYCNADWWLGLAGRDDQAGEQQHKFDNHPADNVSWFDAIAFCSWLSYKLGYRVRLPSEWEWQQAATAGQTDYHYPWGPLWMGSHINSLENDLERSVAVGLYPFAAAPSGALDMSGNVWEWCLNRYDQSEFEQNNDDLAGYDRRVVRGGSWRNDQFCASVHFRDLDSPEVRADDFGFRLLRPSVNV